MVVEHWDIYDGSSLPVGHMQTLVGVGVVCRFGFDFDSDFGFDLGGERNQKGRGRRRC